MNIAPSRPTTLSAGEPAASAQATGDVIQPGLRAVVAAECNALLNRETSRRNTEWQAAVESVRGALVAVERTWGAAVGKLESSTPASVVSDPVETILAAARLDIDAVVRQARVEAQIDIARLADLVGRLNAELQAERDQL